MKSVFFALRRLPLSVGIAVYLTGVALVLAAAGYGGWRVIEAGVNDVAASLPKQGVRAGNVTRAATADSDAVVARQPVMTPLADRWSDLRDRDRSRRPDGLGQFFGGSGRNAYRRSGDDDEDGRGTASGESDGSVTTYRTVCVRLCDGYYFPVSFAVTAERLGRDKAVCESRCGAQGRLFVQRSPGGSAEDLQDLTGRPYSKLPTAFRYRSEYVASCKCQPDPWEEAALERHRLYALAAAARKGDRVAAKELADKVRANDKLRAERPPSSSGPEGDPAAVAASLAKAGEVARREDGRYSRLGTDGDPNAKPALAPPPAAAKSAEQDWVKRAFAPGAMR